MGSFKGIILGTAGIPATVVITSDESDFTDATPFKIQIVFNKPVTGFVVGDITITNATLSNFSGSGASYTADVTPDLSGDISISVAENVTNEGNSASNVVSVTEVTVNQGWNKLGTVIAISGANNEIATHAGASNYISQYVKSNTGHSSGYHKFEIEAINVPNGTNYAIGVVQGSPSQNWLGKGSSLGLWSSGQDTYYNGSFDPSIEVDYGESWIVSFYIRNGQRVWVETRHPTSHVTTIVGGGDPETNTTPTFIFPSAGTIYAGFTPYGLLADRGSVKLLTTSSEFTLPSRGATAWD